jgi:TolA-binding protein
VEDFATPLNTPLSGMEESFSPGESDESFTSHSLLSAKALLSRSVDDTQNNTPSLHEMIDNIAQLQSQLESTQNELENTILGKIKLQKENDSLQNHIIKNGVPLAYSCKRKTEP